MPDPDFQLHPTLAANSIVLAELPLCLLLLANDKNYPWVILVPARADKTELHQLAFEDQRQFMSESNAVAETLEQLFTPDKLNIAAIGNIVPQLHVHHVARFKSDAAWPAPIWGAHPPVRYGAAEKEALKQRLIPTVLEKLKNPAGGRNQAQPMPPARRTGIQSSYVLAQLNIAKTLYPLDTPEMSDFTDNIDRINKLAEESAGFVWRLQTEDGDATSIRHFGEDVIVNMSTWETLDALYDYVFRTEHTEFLKRRKEWFSQSKVYSVLWWQPTDTDPTVDEAARRLELLRTNGPGAEAFTFKTVPAKPTD